MSVWLEMGWEWLETRKQSSALCCSPEWLFSLIIAFPLS